MQHELFTENPFCDISMEKSEGGKESKIFKRGDKCFNLILLAGSDGQVVVLRTVQYDFALRTACPPKNFIVMKVDRFAISQVLY